MLAAGWRDFLKTPLVSLTYGGAFTGISFLIAYGLIASALGSLVLPLGGGFILLAPILVVGLYDVSPASGAEPRRLAHQEWRIRWRLRK